VKALGSKNKTLPYKHKNKKQQLTNDGLQWVSGNNLQSRNIFDSKKMGGGVILVFAQTF